MTLVTLSSWVRLFLFLDITVPAEAAGAHNGLELIKLVRDFTHTYLTPARADCLSDKVIVYWFSGSATVGVLSWSLIDILYCNTESCIVLVLPSQKMNLSRVWCWGYLQIHFSLNECHHWITVSILITRYSFIIAQRMFHRWFYCRCLAWLLLCWIKWRLGIRQQVGRK